jgi:hypothetical protein
MNSGQLLRKQDRCRMLLQIIESFAHDAGRRLRLQDCIALLLESLPERSERIDFSLRLLELESERKFDRIYTWLAQQSDIDQVRFYSIKMRHEADAETECESECVPVPVPEIEPGIIEPDIKSQKTSSSQFEELNQIISDDLKKLSVFESLPDSFNYT